MEPDPDTSANTTPEQALVERFLAAFDRRWPTAAELRALLADDAVFVERPNLVNPRGSTRDRATLEAGVQAGRRVLRWQRYAVRDHVQSGPTVATRLHWSGELATALGDWPAGTVLRAHCVAHYEIRAGRIARIEQHDCYEPPGD